MTQTSDINTKLARAIHAYRIGKSKPINMSLGASGELYIKSSQELIQERLSDDEHAFYVKNRDLSRRAVNLAQQSMYEQSRQHYQKASQELIADSLSEEVSLLLRSRLAQAEAHLEFKSRSWKQARDRLQIAMETDQVLEEQYGYNIFHIQRIHLYHLLIRVEIGEGHFLAAIDLAEKVNQYILGNLESLPIGGGWSKERIENTPAVFRNGMLARITNEVGSLLTTQGFENSKTLFLRFHSWKTLLTHPSLLEIYEWGQLKEAFLAEDITFFLGHCEYFLSRGRHETMLWYIAVLDLCRCCYALRPSQTKGFREEVAKDANQWKMLSPTLLSGTIRDRLINNSSQPESNFSFFFHSPSSRRFQAYNVGLPRTGTSSLASLFGLYQSDTEFMEQETVERIIAVHDGNLSAKEFRDYILHRDQAGKLEMDSASFNHFYLDILIEEFPQAKFVFTIRDCYSWLNSYFKLLLKYRKRFDDQGIDPPVWMVDYGRIFFGELAWDVWEPFSSPQYLQQKLLELPEILDAFLRHWGESNRRILELLPRERSLVIRTHELADKLDELARFINIPSYSLTSVYHTNISAEKIDLLSVLDEGMFDQRTKLYCSDVLEQIFPL